VHISGFLENMEFACLLSTFSGLKKVSSQCWSGQVHVDSPSGQVPFHVFLLVGKGPVDKSFVN